MKEKLLETLKEEVEKDKDYWLYIKGTDILEVIEEERKKAVEGFKPRQISGFYRDDLGRWFKRYPTGGVLVTDVILTDSLNVRQEMIDEIETYLKENNG